MDYLCFGILSWMLVLILPSQTVIGVEPLKKDLVTVNGVVQQNQNYVPPTVKPNTVLVDRLRLITDSFVINSYHDLITGSPGANVFYSPLSIYSALLMAYVGAGSETRTELGGLLCLSQAEIQDTTSLDYVNLHFLTFISQIFSHTNTTNYQLDFANRIGVQSGLTIQPDYITVLRNFYNSDVTNYNFSTETEKSRLDINAFVSNVTHAKIPNLLAPGTLDPSSVLILINAIYFKANWQYKFESSLTQDMKFFTNGDIGPVRTARIMTARRRVFYTYSRELKAQVVEVPYQSEELSMVLVLPRTLTGMDFTLSQFDVGKWRELQDTMDMRLVDLKIPKFKMETSYDLVPLLSRMGAVHLFTGADLSGMLQGGENVPISAAVHKAFVEVNEEGTEAAAATGIVFSRSAVARPEEVKEFRADHPFLFAIRHNPTNLILFMGRLSDPTVSS